MSTAIDSLDNDGKLHIGIIIAINLFICLAQKYGDSDYACGLVFGYGTDKLFYQTKQQGVWKAVRDI